MTSAEQLVRTAADLMGAPLRLQRALTGGEHARTLAVTDRAGTAYVVRGFPAGDPAVTHEVRVLDRVATLGDLVPRLVAYDDRPDQPVIITTRVAGGHPDPELDLDDVAVQMAGALARVHALPGDGLRTAPITAPSGKGPAAHAARQSWDALDMTTRVLTHFDFWCGNALWEGRELTGVVDWSGARSAPRGVDVAWARQDLVLLGSPHASQVFQDEYQRLSGQTLSDLHEWDVQAAAQAEPAVETWAPNYAGIGRTELDGAVLRRRLTSWIGHLLT